MWNKLASWLPLRKYEHVLMALPVSQDLTVSFALKMIVMTEQGKVFLSPYEERKLRDIAKITIVILIDLINIYLHANNLSNL
jgi:hypothetical protein